MAKIFGEFNDKYIKSQEFLRLGFSPSSVSLQQRWRNNGLSADFFADYLTTFFPTDDNNPNTIKRETELKDAVSYIANELLENAMKFNDDNYDYPISIQFQLYDDNLRLSITNSIPAENVAKFQSFIKTLLNTDPQDLYMRQLEHSDETDGISSGLGLLTMIDSYGAKLGWKFETFQLVVDSYKMIPYIEKISKFKRLFFLFGERFFSSAKNPKITVVTTMVQLPILVVI